MTSLFHSLKRLWPYLRVYRGTIIVVILLGALMSLTASGAAMMGKSLFDDGFAKKISTFWDAFALRWLVFILFTVSPGTFISSC
ncbi:MAG: hypothetical protein K2X47_12960 [Bdellovibrionales bacterium]|nr:hypothetical protein [Bdellovibrionales bacterium]